MSQQYDGSIRIDTRVDESGLNKGVKSITGSLGELTAAVGAAFSLAAIVAFGTTAVQAASRVEEMTSKFNAVFKNLSRSVEAQLDDFAKAANRSKTELMGFAATMQDTFVPLGFAREQAADMSVQVVKLAEDLASFNNLPTADVIRDIQSALVGNTETVRKYGVVLNQQMIEERARAMGLWSGAGAMSAQVKALVSLRMITEGNADAQGDAIRTADSFANRMRGLTAAFTDFKGAVGNSIIPIINQFIPYLQAALQALTRFFTVVAGIVNMLLGTNIGLAQAAGAMGDIADNTGAAADAQNDLASGVKAAGKAAKGALAAFDSLNVLQQADTGAGAGGAGGAGAGGIGDLGMGDPAADGGVMDTIAEKAEKVRLFLQPLTDAFGRLRDALLPLGQTIWAGLLWAWDNILVPFGTWVFQDLLPAFLDLLGISLENLNLLILALKPAALWLWENLLKPAAEWTGEAIIIALEWLTERLKDLNVWIKENESTFAAIVAIIAIVILVLLAMSNPIALVIAGIIAIIAIIKNWGAIWEWLEKKNIEVWNAISEIWKGVADWFKTKVFGPMFLEAALALYKIKDKFREIFDGIAGFVKGSINRIIDYINGMIQGAIGGINTVVTGLNKIGSAVPGYSPVSYFAAPQIPRLATGAVIPPNAEFLAILGDQKSGRNIEAPEGLIRQIIAEEIGKMGTNVTVNFTGTLAALVREMKPEIDIENKRVGSSLVGA